MIGGTVGLLSTVFSLSLMCSTALMAYFSDRHGRRPVYLASVALFAIGSLCIAAAPSFDLLLVSRAIQGIWAGGIAPVASAVIGDVFTAERRGRILGLIGATHGMAFVLGPPLANALTSKLGVGFSMGGIVFLTTIATLAYGVSIEYTGLALLPLVLCSMVGSMAAGRLLNRLGARNMVIFGFGLLTLGYLQSVVPQTGFTAFVLASVLVGIGLGVVVSGALRSLAIDEAPPAQRASAQGLINIFNAVGTLLAVTCISAIADFEGGGLTGFSFAYLALGLSMHVMLVVAFGLNRKSTDSVTEPTSSVGT